MSFLDTIKQLFGFTSAPPVRPPVSQSVPTGPRPNPGGPPPAAQRRDQMLRFILEKLRAYQNEPETAPVGLRLGIVGTSPDEEQVYRVALWASQAGKFRDELGRQLSDNYIELPPDWQFEYVFSPDSPLDCTYREGNLCLIVLDKSTAEGAPRLARIVALVGQTEQPDYALNPAQKTVFSIGRGHKVQTASGRVLMNDIVFLNETDPGFDPQLGSGNGAVSRSHATIRYDMAQQQYALLIDEGGLPASGNKTKIIHPDNKTERADIGGMVYPLRHGDQIELGGEVTLLFEIE